MSMFFITFNKLVSFQNQILCGTNFFSRTFKFWEKAKVRKEMKKRPPLSLRKILNRQCLWYRRRRQREKETGWEEGASENRKLGKKTFVGPPSQAHALLSHPHVTNSNNACYTPLKKAVTKVYSILMRNSVQYFIF